MAEQSEWRLYKPHLKAHRLVRAEKSAAHTQVTLAVFVDAEPQTANSQPGHAERLAGWTAGPVLVGQASAIAQGAQPMLNALPAQLEKLKASEAEQEALGLL